MSEPYSTKEAHDPFGFWSQYPTPVSGQDASAPDSSTIRPSPQRLEDLEAVPAEHLPQNQYLSHKEAVPGCNQDIYPEAIYEKDDDRTGSSGKYSYQDTEKTTSIATKKTIFGIGRRSFILVAFIIGVSVIAAVLGGVLASQLNSNNTHSTQTTNNGKNPEPTPSNTPTPSNKNDTKPQTTVDGLQILGTSRLAASNWTDADGIQHKLVYFQDSHDHLVSRAWDSADRQWSTTNITQLLTALDPAMPTPAPGSTIAALSSDLHPEDGAAHYVFFLDGDDRIRSYYASQETGAQSSWEHNAMDGLDQQVYPASDLAATYQRLSGDGGVINEHLILAFQGTKGHVYVANSSTSWTTASNDDKPVLGRKKIVGGATPLALSPFWDGRPDALGLVWQNYGEGGWGEMDLKWWTQNNPVWTEDENSGGYLIPGLSEPETLHDQHFAVSKMGEGLSQTLWLVRKNDGSIAANWFDGNDDMVLDEVDFRGYEAENLAWQSIAAAHGGWFYGISGGRILEFKMEANTPGVLEYNGMVYP